MNQCVEMLDINGVKVPLIYEEDKNLPIISFRLVVRASGMIEAGKKVALSRLSAKLLEEGTKKLGSEKFSQKLEEKAINFDVGSGADTFNFTIGCLKENFEFGLDMLCKLFEDPNYSDDVVKKLKTLMLGQIMSKKSDFDYIANSELQKLLYPNSPLGNSSLGSEKDVEKLSLKDVKEFLKTHIDSTNAMAVIGGDLSLEKAKEYAKKPLSILQKGKKRETPFYETSDAQKVKIIKKQTEQAYIYFGAPYDAKLQSEDNYKAKVAAFILGSSGFGSRMMEEIRVKRGLAYSAYCRVIIEKTNSKFAGYLQTKNENKDEAKKVVEEVINEFVENGVSADELEKAKKFLLGSEPLGNETLSQRLGKAFSEIYSGFELGFFKEQLELIEGLSLESLNAYIKNHDEIKKLSFAIVTDEN